MKATIQQSHNANIRRRCLSILILFIVCALALAHACFHLVQPLFDFIFNFQ